MPLVACVWVSLRSPMPGIGSLSREVRRSMTKVSISATVEPGRVHSSPRSTQSWAKLSRASWKPFAWPSAPSSTAGVRVDDGVEDGPADVLREEMGVDAAEFGAVRDAEVVELVVAEDLAHQVHVPGGVLGADVRQGGARVLVAAGRVLLLRVGERQLLGLVVGGEVEGVVGVELLVGEAFHRVAAAHPARVERDQVEAAAQGLVVLGEAGQPGDAGAAGPAEVEDQRTDPPVLVPGAGPDQRELDGLALRHRPVERRLEEGALPGGAPGERGGGGPAALGGGRCRARGPGQFLRRQPGGRTARLRLVRRVVAPVRAAAWRAARWWR